MKVSAEAPLTPLKQEIAVGLAHQRAEALRDAANRLDTAQPGLRELLAQSGLRTEVVPEGLRVTEGLLSIDLADWGVIEGDRLTLLRTINEKIENRKALYQYTVPFALVMLNLIILPGIGLDTKLMLHDSQFPLLAVLLGFSDLLWAVLWAVFYRPQLLKYRPWRWLDRLQS